MAKRRDMVCLSGNGKAQLVEKVQQKLGFFVYKR